ncbi:MAG: nuclear transport factor 2 family protein [Hyphomicrobiaceae bacterium]|jgi:ketosteroid isomerase-like protein
MLRVLCLCLLWVVPAASAWAHPPAILNQAAEKAVIEEVAEFRRLLAAAIEKKDAAALRTHYADAFVHTHGSGKVDGKDARIVSALAGDPVIENAPVTDLVIRVPGGWTAIATGVSPIKSMADGKTYSFRWTAVYVRMGDGWQIAASQATRLPEVK